MDTEQPIESLDQSDELRLRNAELKKELEREKMLHKMLFKEWEELTAEMAAHKQDGYENSRPKNLFYKYAFYVLLITLLPVFYFLNPLADNKRPSSFQTVSDTVRPANASETRTSATRTNTLPVKDSASAERIFLSIGFEINSNSAGYEATRVSHFVLIIASHTFCLLPICKAQKKCYPYEKNIINYQVKLRSNMTTSEVKPSIYWHAMYAVTHTGGITRLIEFSNQKHGA